MSEFKNSSPVTLASDSLPSVVVDSFGTSSVSPPGATPSTSSRTTSLLSKSPTLPQTAGIIAAAAEEQSFNKVKVTGENFNTFVSRAATTHDTCKKATERLAIRAERHRGGIDGVVAVDKGSASPPLPTPQPQYANTLTGFLYGHTALLHDSTCSVRRDDEEMDAILLSQIRAPAARTATTSVITATQQSKRRAKYSVAHRRALLVSMGSPCATPTSPLAPSSYPESTSSPVPNDTEDDYDNDREEEEDVLLCTSDSTPLGLSRKVLSESVRKGGCALGAATRDGYKEEEGGIGSSSDFNDCSSSSAPFISSSDGCGPYKRRQQIRRGGKGGGESREELEQEDQHHYSSVSTSASTSVLSESNRDAGTMTSPTLFEGSRSAGSYRSLSLAGLGSFRQNNYNTVLISASSQASSSLAMSPASPFSSPTMQFPSGHLSSSPLSPQNTNAGVLSRRRKNQLLLEKEIGKATLAFSSSLDGSNYNNNKEIVKKKDGIEKAAAAAGEEVEESVAIRRAPGPRRLYAFNEIPSHLQDNEYILHYYRAFMTTSECVESMFEIHNETGNIWTHLLGVFVYMGMLWWVQRDVIIPRHDGMEVVHRLMFTILSLSMMACLGASAMFHTMLAHEQVWIFKLAHALDYAGATCLMTGTFIPLCYYAFVCQPMLQIGYITMACVLGVTGVVAPLLPWFENDDAFFARLGIYASIGASAAVPSFNLLFTTPLNNMTIPIYFGIGFIFVNAFFAVVIYASNFPERFAPGKFDLWFNSHQIWHTLIFLGCVVQYFNVVALYQNWSIMQGHC